MKNTDCQNCMFFQHILVIGGNMFKKENYSDYCIKRKITIVYDGKSCPLKTKKLTHEGLIKRKLTDTYYSKNS